MQTEFGFIGTDGIEYATEAEAYESQTDDVRRYARPPPFFLK